MMDFTIDWAWYEATVQFYLREPDVNTAHQMQMLLSGHPNSQLLARAGFRFVSPQLDSRELGQVWSGIR